MFAAGNHLHRVHAAHALVTIGIELDAGLLGGFTNRLPRRAGRERVEALEEHAGALRPGARLAVAQPGCCASAEWRHRAALSSDTSVGGCTIRRSSRNSSTCWPSRIRSPLLNRIGRDTLTCVPLALPRSLTEMTFDSSVSARCRRDKRRVGRRNRHIRRFPADHGRSGLEHEAAHARAGFVVVDDGGGAGAIADDEPLASGADHGAAIEVDRTIAVGLKQRSRFGALDREHVAAVGRHDDELHVGQRGVLRKRNVAVAANRGRAIRLQRVLVGLDARWQDATSGTRGFRFRRLRHVRADRPRSRPRRSSSAPSCSSALSGDGGGASTPRRLRLRELELHVDVARGLRASA